MEERGYNTKAYHKQQRKGSRDLSFLPKIAIATIIVASSIIGGKQLIDNFFQRQSKTSEIGDLHEELAQEFIDCLNSINTEELAPEDANYSTSIITRLKEQLSCYEIYSEISNPTEKATLQSQLTELESISQNSNLTKEELQKRYAEIDAEHQRTIAQINRNYAASIAKLDAEKADGDARYKEWLANYDKEKTARDAEYAKQRAEWEASNKAKQEEEAKRTVAKEVACEEYKAKFGEKTAAELAETDAEVVGAKNKWSQALKKVSGCTGGNRVMSQAWRDTCNSARAQEQQTANSYESAYQSLLSQKTAYYRNLKIEACGY
ncbi:hypothetical protein J6D24_02310 [Candidatus Saccharibacteria bacterium]|nr:hypothetical protein [Candidatus Saccharibacteria bacterium]